MSASPEMAALVDDLDDAAHYVADALLTRSTPEWKAAKAARNDARDTVLAAIAKIEAARDEATRRLAVVEEAVRGALAQLNDDRNNAAMDTLRAAMESPK